jgi:invasion protein IalB
MRNSHKLPILSTAVLLALSSIAAAQQSNSLRSSAPPAATPSQIELPQSTTATYGTWIVQCQSHAGPPAEKACDMAQVTQAQGSSSPFSRVAIGEPLKGQAIKLVVQLPVNASFSSNVRIQTGDSDAGIAAPFARCIPGGCFAEFDLKEDVLKKFRGSSGNGKLTFADSTGHEVAVPLSFNGFAQAFDALARE